MKLKSRKFWIAVCVTAYFALMAIRELNFENSMATIICSVCAAVVTISYIAIEGMSDTERIANEDDGEGE